MVDRFGVVPEGALINFGTCRYGPRSDWDLIRGRFV